MLQLPRLFHHQLMANKNCPTYLPEFGGLTERSWRREEENREERNREGERGGKRKIETQIGEAKQPEKIKNYPSSLTEIVLAIDLKMWEGGSKRVT